jgi:hypothetical protein
VKTEKGKNMPVDPDGTPHWGTCPKASDFKGGKRAKTETPQRTRLKIVSDGTRLGTQIMTTDGARLEGVTSIDWHLDSRGRAKCTLGIVLIDVDLESDDIETVIEHISRKAMS